jgi:hypothetical protein
LGFARQDIGTRPISEISAAEILVPLRKVEGNGNYETARRLRAIIGQVFRYAIATARVENDLDALDRTLGHTWLRRRS